MRRVRLAALLLAAAVVAACGVRPGGSGPGGVQPRDGRSGLHLSGTVAGRQIAVSDGLPTLLVGDCDPPDGPDDDVCFVSRTIDGRLLVVSLENPDVLEPGVSLPVEAPGCAGARACDAVEDVAIVDVQLDTQPRRRATSGSLRLDVVEPFRRYAGLLTVGLPGGGRLSGRFDVVPRPKT